MQLGLGLNLGGNNFSRKYNLYVANGAGSHEKVYAADGATLKVKREET